MNPATSAAATTLNATDIIDGGAGTDTLNITNDGTNNVAIVGTISGVEVVNIDNTGAGTAANTAAGVLSAAAFSGATSITQIGGAAATTSGLASTTTAGFKSGAVSASVTAASTAATATITLDKVAGVNGTLLSAGVATNLNKIAAFTVSGASLSAVNVSGTVKTDASGTTGRVGAVDLTIKGGASAVGAALDVSLNTSILTKVTLKTASTSGNVASFDASASTGAIEFNGDSANSAGTPVTNAVASIKTGSGDDIVAIRTATAIDNVDTAKVETVSASLSTGAGDDSITILTGGAGSTTVDAGAGDDSITLDGLSAKASVAAGAGDDTVTSAVAKFVAGVSVSGGEGTDTLVLTDAAFTTANYLSLDAYTSSFEGVTLIGDDVVVNVSKLRSEVASVTLSELQSATSAGATVTGIDNETIVMGEGAKFSLSSLGYLLGSGSTATTYGSSNTAILGATATVTANAAALGLTVATEDSGGNVTGTLAGDLKTASVTLVSTRDTTATGASAGTESLAGLSVTLDAGSAVTLNALTELKVTGAGALTLDVGVNAGASDPSGKLDLIDLSGMTAFVNLDAAGDQVTGSGFGYQNLSTSSITLNDTNAEVLKLGGGDDAVTAASTLAKMDTIEGYQLTALASSATTVDAAKSDSLDVSGRSIGVVSGVATVKAITISSSATTLSQALLEAGNAVNSSNTALDNVVFKFGGDTYFYGDDATAGYSDADVVIKFVGELNLTLLAQTIA